MVARVQNIAAEQGSRLTVTLRNSRESIAGRTMVLHVRSDKQEPLTKIVASTANGRITEDTATSVILDVTADIMAAVSVVEDVETWVYDLESYTNAEDVRRDWEGDFVISRNVTRSTEPDTESATFGSVRYDSPQALTDAEKLQARENIGAGTGGGGGGSGDVVGPASATDDRIAAFDGTTGKLIKQGGVTATAVASHLSSTSNPHSVTAAQVGADATGTAAAAVVAHTGATDPHGDRSFATSAISTHAAATDPHGDRAFATSAVSTHSALTTGAHGITAAGAALLDDADAAAQRTTLGLGTAATQASSAFEASGAVSTHNAVTTAHGISAYGATLVDDADAATARTTLGLGTAATTAATDYATAAHNHSGVYQPSDAELTAIAGLTSAADSAPYFTGSGTAALMTVTAAGRALIDDADASAQRTTLGLTALATTTPGTGVATALGVSVGSAGAVVTNGGALGTPSSGALTNCTGYPAASTSTSGIVELVITSEVNTGTDNTRAMTVEGYKDSTPYYVDRAADWTLALTDRNKDQWFNNGASALVCTIPLNATVAFAVGDTIPFVRLASGTATIDAATSVTLNGVSGGSCTISTRYQGALLKKIATDSWVVSGDVSAVA